MIVVVAIGLLIGGYMLFLLIQGIMSGSLTVFVFMISMFTVFISGAMLVLGMIVPKSGLASIETFAVFTISAISFGICSWIMDRKPK